MKPFALSIARAQFRSYLLPLVIMAPIPLTVIWGLLPVHALLGAQFTATSMIGMIALAAMLGAVFILDDPISNGLAVALIFGILIRTALALLVISLYYPLACRAAEAA